MGNLSAYLGYKKYSGTSARDFCWNLFGEEIVLNMIDNGYNRAKIPLKDKFGDIHYLGKRYSLLGVMIDKDNL